MHSVMEPSLSISMMNIKGLNTELCDVTLKLSDSMFANIAWCLSSSVWCVFNI